MKLPDFKSIEEESEFWDSHDAADYLEDTVEVDIRFVDARPDLPITVRLPRAAMAQLKTFADQQGADPRTLLQTWTMERLTVLSADTDRTQANPIDKIMSPVSAR